MKLYIHRCLLLLVSLFFAHSGWADSVENISPTAFVKFHKIEQQLKANPRWTFTVKLTPIFNRTLKEITGYVPDEAMHQRARVVFPRMSRPLPVSYDLRQVVKGGLTPVRDQGQCGDCWAFSTVDVFQDVMKQSYGLTTLLSPQELTSCDSNFAGCGGGDVAFDYFVNPGATTENQFPYQAANVSCNTSVTYPYRATSWAYVGNNTSSYVSSDVIKQAILQYGAVTTAFKATGPFMGYSSGVFNACTGWFPLRTNHLIEIVGWNDSPSTGQGYWIVKNSWGTSWGMNGYANVAYQCNGVGTDVASVVAESPIPQ